ncbi:MAG: TolC family protein, partial [bacterium]
MQAQRAAEGAAQARLRQAVQLAVQEVEDAALAVQQTEAERAAVQRQRDAARLAYEDACDRYTRGLVNLTTVLQTLTAWQAAELTLLSASRAAVGAHITLHDALGGDWPAPL